MYKWKTRHVADVLGSFFDIQKVLPYLARKRKSLNKMKRNCVQLSVLFPPRQWTRVRQICGVIVVGVGCVGVVVVGVAVVVGGGAGVVGCIGVVGGGGVVACTVVC